MRRDYCASGPSRSVTEEELSDTDRGGPTGEEREHAHGILDKGGPNPILQHFEDDNIVI